MVTESAFGRLKSGFRVLHRKCESNQDTVKMMGLACVVLHNICIERGDLVPRSMDLRNDPSSNKRRSRNEIREILDLVDHKSKTFEHSRASGIKVRDKLTQYFRRESNA